MTVAMKTGRVVYQGRSIKSVVNRYQLHTSGTDAPTGKWSDEILTVTALQRYLWCYTITEYTNGVTEETDPFVLAVYGDSGEAGVVYYPAGSWSEIETYIWNGKTCPVVEYNGEYYALEKTEETIAGLTGGVTPQADVASDIGNWSVFDKLKYTMTDVAFINFGKLASAVFYDRYMFSQYGVDASGGSTVEYENFGKEDIDDPMNTGNSFQPNILFDFLEGKSWLRDVTIGGNNPFIKLGTSGNTIEMSAANRSISLKASGEEVGKIAFNDEGYAWLNFMMTDKEVKLTSTLLSLISGSDYISLTADGLFIHGSSYSTQITDSAIVVQKNATGEEPVEEAMLYHEGLRIKDSEGKYTYYTKDGGGGGSGGGASIQVIQSTSEATEEGILYILGTS